MNFYDFFNFENPHSIFENMSEESWLHTKLNNVDYFKNCEKRIKEYKNSYKKQHGFTQN